MFGDQIVVPIARPMASAIGLLAPAVGVEASMIRLLPSPNALDQWPPVCFCKIFYQVFKDKTFYNFLQRILWSTKKYFTSLITFYM